MRPDLLTGATGFIGSHLSERLLRQGRKLRVLCRSSSLSKLLPEIRTQAEVVVGDLTERQSLEQAVSGVDRIFHCAGFVSDWGDPHRFESTNVRGTEWLLEAAQRTGVNRFVHLSSIAVFGVPAPREINDESAYQTSNDQFSRTKIESERIVLRFHAVHGMPVVVLRPGVVYGMRGAWLEEPLSMIRAGKMFLIAQGEGTCHPCYVENLVDAMVLAGNHPNAIGQSFIVGDGESLSFKEYFNHLARLAETAEIERSIPLWAARTLASSCELVASALRSETRPLLTHTAIDMLIPKSRISTRKIEAILGFKPRFSVSAAMQDVSRRLLC